MSSLNFSLDCSVLICARRETVFRYFTDTKRWADWWGAGSQIDARPGGAVRIVYPGEVAATGEVLEVVDNQRVVFSYGYEGPGKLIPPGGSRVTITLEETPSGTRVKLRHEVADARTRDAHVQGWRYQLALFANVVAREQHAGAASVIDHYFELWTMKDAAARRRELSEVATSDVAFQDAYGCVAGADDFDAHIVACQQHMPGVALRRDGEVRQCQGTALADWNASGPDGAIRARGTNVFHLAPDGKIARVVGFWSS